MILILSVSRTGLAIANFTATTTADANAAAVTAAGDADGEDVATGRNKPECVCGT